MGIWSPMAGLDVVQICSDVVSDVVHIKWDFQATSLLSTCRPLERRRLSNFLFSNLGLLIAVSNRECFGNPCGGRGVSPQLNAGSQHLYLSVVSVVKFNTYDLDIFGCFFRCRSLNGIPSKHLKLRIRCGAAANYEPRSPKKCNFYTI